eukprot:UN06301
MTGKGSKVRLMERVTHYSGNYNAAHGNGSRNKYSPVPNVANNPKGWNVKNKSKHLRISANGLTVENKGSNDTWTCAVGNMVYKHGRSQFEIEIEKDARSSNTWKCIVGVVPAGTDFKAEDSAWLGSQNSWGP